mmetsp:Transcript_4677/g.6828  ORF Transcript_4677/g.6828 Transcript_4677/m.6828 type:complete len:102 (+) Transcript_4677:119-424(+)
MVWRILLAGDLVRIINGGFRIESQLLARLPFFVSAFVATFGLASWLSYTGALTTLSMNTASLAVSIAWISLACTVVELLPFGDDNWTVPIVGGVLAETMLS